VKWAGKLEAVWKRVCAVRLKKDCGRRVKGDVCACGLA
jgi:hypothetical protein